MQHVATLTNRSGSNGEFLLAVLNNLFTSKNIENVFFSALVTIDEVERIQLFDTTIFQATFSHFQRSGGLAF